MATHLYNQPPFGFPVLLLSLLSLLLVPAHFPIQGKNLLVTLILAWVLLSCLYLVVYNKKELIIGVVLAIPTLSINWLTSMLPGDHYILISNFMHIVFLIYIVIHLLRYLFETTLVSLNMIFAAICLYLIVGLIFSFVYLLVELISPGSFNFSTIQIDYLSDHKVLLSQFSYFSNVTLSTLGYGDITPLSRIAQSWAIIEAIFGQFYLAIVVARLVSLHLVAKQRPT